MAEEDDTLRERVRAEPACFGEFVAQRRERLRRMVELRMDRRLRGRIDASDVVQEACVEAIERLPEWLAGEAMPLHLWLRFLTAQKLLQLHRHHLGAAMRDPTREDASAALLAEAIVESGVLSPSGVASREEAAAKLHGALATMKAEDREVLLLRHFEQLGNAEVAALLHLSAPGASLRYMRAARRLRELLAEF